MKTLVYKNQGQELIHQKYKANENISKHNPKKKQTNLFFLKKGKNLMQIGPMATK
jgi:hypothetical protein